MASGCKTETGRRTNDQAGIRAVELQPNLITKVNLDDSKRNMSRGNSLSDELELSSVLGDTRAYPYSPVWG